MKRFTIIIFLCFKITAAANIFVSPKGDDNGNGSLLNPFKTIKKAKDAARLIDDHVYIFLREGTYKLKETIVFNIKDGNVTYSAYKNEKPIISSGEPIVDWDICTKYPEGTPLQAKGYLWVADIPKGISDFKVLFDGNNRLQRAHSLGFQTPEIKFKKLATRNVANKKDSHLLYELTFPKGRIKNWENIEDVEAFFNGVPWTQNISALEKVDTQNNIASLKFAGNTPPSTTPKPYNPTYIENVIDVLDSPGEWCVNTKTRKIYYWPINGQPSETIEVPTLIEFFRVEGEIDYKGEQDIPVKNINFKGLTFTKGNRYSWWKGHKGWGIQHDWDKFDYGNALLRFRGAENCIVDECTFINSGNSAIRLDLHAQNITIKNSLIDRVGHMGILLCGYGPGKKDVNKNNTIINNLIRRVGEVIWHGHAIFVWQSGNNHIANNHIRENPRKAIGICGVRGAIFQNGKEIDWDEAAKTIRWDELKYQNYSKGNQTQEKILPYLHARNNLVENNYIYRTRTKIGDGASLNVSGAGTGNVIRKNMLYMTLGNGMRCDDWQNGTIFDKNLILSGGIVHKGKNDITNNVLLNSTIRFSFYPDQQPNPGSKVKGNIFYMSRFMKPYVGRTSKTMATPEICDLENNLYYLTEKDDRLNAFISKQQSENIENNAIIINPKFETAIDLKKELHPSDFRFMAQSPSLKIGYTNSDFENIGLLNNYPDHLLAKVFPNNDGVLISNNAEVSSSSPNYTGNLTDITKTNKKNLEQVFKIENEDTPYVQLKWDKTHEINGIKIIADYKDRNNTLRGLTVWVSQDAQTWNEIWRADPYHIAMGRDWFIKLNTSTKAKYLRVGLRPKSTIQLANHDDRGKSLLKKSFYLNSIFVYAEKE